MATRLENKFAELKQAGRKALIIYTCPTLRAPSRP